MGKPANGFPLSSSTALTEYCWQAPRPGPNKRADPGIRAARCMRKLVYKLLRPRIVPDHGDGVLRNLESNRERSRAFPRQEVVPGSPIRREARIEPGSDPEQARRRFGGGSRGQLCTTLWKLNGRWPVAPAGLHYHAGSAAQPDHCHSRLFPVRRPGSHLTGVTHMPCPTIGRITVSTEPFSHHAQSHDEDSVHRSSSLHFVRFGRFLPPSGRRNFRAFAAQPPVSADAIRCGPAS